MRRLLYVANASWFFASQRIGLARRALAEGYEVHFAAPPDASTSQIEAQGIKFHPLPMSRRSILPWSELGTLERMKQTLERVRPDILHLITPKAVIYGGIAAQRTGVPAVVSSISGLGYVFIKRGLRAAALRRAVREAYSLAFSHPNNTVIFENKDDRRFFELLGVVRQGQATVIPGAGVDCDVFVPRPNLAERAPVVVLGARMLWDKGIGEFVEAARLVKRSCPEVRFVLAGGTDPDNPAAIPAAVLEEWKAEGVVDWLGRRNDMPDILASADIACLPSYREGMPTFLAEAASSGLPLVGTDVPGCREIIEHNRNGLLVPERDGVALAAALLTLVKDKDLRQRMGRDSRGMVVERFSLEKIARQSLSVYHSLLDAARSGANITAAQVD